MSAQLQTPVQEDGDISKTPADLIAALYPELRRIARGFMGRERDGHTLQPTALANEALTKLLGRDLRAYSSDPKALLSACIREMQTILIDWGRHHQQRLADQRERSKVPLLEGNRFSIEDVVHLQFCLEHLGQIDSRARQVVELRFFTGMTVQETAEFLGVAPRTVNDDWEFARCWLAKNWGAR